MSRRRGKEAAERVGELTPNRPTPIVHQVGGQPSDLDCAQTALNGFIRARRLEKINGTAPGDWVAGVKKCMEIGYDVAGCADATPDAKLRAGNLIAKGCDLISGLERDAYEAADAKAPTSMTQININLPNPPGGRHDVPGLLDETP